MNYWTRLRESFLLMPGLLCLVSAALAEGLIIVDRRIGEIDLGPFGFLVNRVGAAGSRDLLGAIAGSMLTVAATTFSITIAVLALSSSTYGPRLVRNFMADRGNQLVLGVFVSTFLYALLVLRSIRTIENRPAESFVPHLAVNTAVLLAVVAIGVLVYFIHHISDSVQVWTLARQVRTELVSSVEHLYPDRLGHDSMHLEDAGGPADLPDGFDADGVAVRSQRIGYVQSVDEGLLTLARSHDVCVALRVRPGSHTNQGTTLAVVWPAERATEGLLAKVRDVIVVGQARTPHQDVEFAVLLLEEMAVRALSPSTNDPYTALNALDDLSAGLVLLAGRRSPSMYRYDDEHRLRVVAPRVELVDLLDRVLDAMRRYAIDHPSVLHRTLDLVQQVGARTTRAEVHDELVEQTLRLVQAYEKRSPQPGDLDALRRHAARTSRCLTGVAGQDPWC